MTASAAHDASVRMDVVGDAAAAAGDDWPVASDACGRRAVGRRVRRRDGRVRPLPSRRRRRPRARPRAPDDDRASRPGVSGAAAVPLLSAIGAPRDVLRRIWDLADADRSGLLTWDEFVLAIDVASPSEPRRDASPPRRSRTHPGDGPPSRQDGEEAAGEEAFSSTRREPVSKRGALARFPGTTTPPPTHPGAARRMRPSRPSPPAPRRRSKRSRLRPNRLCRRAARPHGSPRVPPPSVLPVMIIRRSSRILQLRRAGLSPAAWRNGTPAPRAAGRSAACRRAERRRYARRSTTPPTRRTPAPHQRVLARHRFSQRSPAQRSSAGRRAADGGANERPGSGAVGEDPRGGGGGARGAVDARGRREERRRRLRRARGEVAP